MGKEMIFKKKPFAFSATSAPHLQERPSLESLRTELGVVWGSTEPLNEETVKENGKVFVTIREGGIDMKVICSGLANKENKSVEIFKRLMEIGVIGPKTRIFNFLRHQNHMWCKESIETCLLNSGDALMIIIESPDRASWEQVKAKSISRMNVCQVRRRVKKPTVKIQKFQ